MKIKLLIATAGVIIFGGLSPFAFSNAKQAGSEQSFKKSSASSSVSGVRHEMPMITNEAEYAEFQQQRELASHTSSSSARSNIVSSRSVKSPQ